MQLVSIILTLAASAMAAPCDPTTLSRSFLPNLDDAGDCAIASGFTFAAGAVPTADVLQKMVQAPKCLELYTEMQMTARSIQPACLLADGSDITLIPSLPLEKGFPALLQTINGGSSGAPGAPGAPSGSGASGTPGAPGAPGSTPSTTSTKTTPTTKDVVKVPVSSAASFGAITGLALAAVAAAM